jgi:hypothetical protein
MPKFIDISGNRYGRLIVKSRDHDHPSKNTMWHCVCDCGKEKTINGYSLVRGSTKSCGCIQREIMRQLKTTHGGSHRGKHTPEYKTWAGMKKRCYDENNNTFINYGGKGVKMCERWLESFDNFLADMGRKPSPKHSIDRLDSSGDYSPENCRWATQQQQANNKSSNRVISYKGQSKTIAQWSRVLNMKYAALYGRFERGWSVERALEVTCGR